MCSQAINGLLGCVCLFEIPACLSNKKGMLVKDYLCVCYSPSTSSPKKQFPTHLGMSKSFIQAGKENKILKNRPLLWTYVSDFYSFKMHYSNKLGGFDIVFNAGPHSFQVSNFINLCWYICMRPIDKDFAYEFFAQ